MSTYRYTYTPGDGRDGWDATRSRVFPEKNDKKAIARILKERGLFLDLGGFLTNEKLERGTLRKVGVKLLFTPMRKISIPKGLL